MAFAPDETTHNAAPTLDAPKTPPRGASAYLVVIAGPSFGEMYRLRADRVVVGRGDKTDIRIVDDGISREHAAVQREGGKVVLVDLGSTNGTYWNGARVPRQELADGDKISIGASTILKFTIQDHLEEHLQKQLFESALRDGLTNTFNRRYFLDRLHGELRFAVRHRTPIALLFVDIDHFRKINDTHGHQAGDQLLAGLARVLMTTLRAEDVLARYGGDEFAVICREIELEGAQALGKRLVAAAAERPFEISGKQIPVTISVGAAVDRGRSEPQALVAAADAAMYEAKRTGRNRVSLHAPREG
jgi:diguanylate cyclase (GGDEF)-like protein